MSSFPISTDSHLPTKARSDGAVRAPLDWLARFGGAVRFGDRLRLLAEFGLSDADIAKATPGAAVRSIRRWRTQGAPVTKASERWEPIDDLCAVISFFLADGSYDEDAIVSWLRSRQRVLENRRPLDVLGEGLFSAVLDGAEQTVGLQGVAERDSVFSTQPGHAVNPTPRPGQSRRRAGRDAKQEIR